jgi:hypothetical protein
MTKALCTVLTLMGILTCGCQPTPPQPTVASQPAAAKPDPAKPTSNWSVETNVNPMDNAVTKFIVTGYGVKLVLCFKNGKPCSVPIAAKAPGSCRIESNVEGSNWNRRIRVKFDDDKPAVETWGITDDRKALYPHNDQVFLARLRKHKQLMLEFGCSSSDPGEVITLKIEGLQEVLKTVQQ